jgi:serine/threonine protein kinase
MTEPGLVTRLCEIWEDAKVSGRTLTVEELCRDCREAIPDVERAIAYLQAGDCAIAGPADPGAASLPALPSDCRFRLTRYLAQGGLGRVYIAEDLELRRTVAVKFVRPDRATAAARRRFRSEAEITGRLEHAGIVPVYGLVEQPDGGFCYAMRLLQGRTLADAIDALPPWPDRSAALRPLLRHVPVRV